MFDLVFNNLTRQTKRWISEWNRTSIDRKRFSYPAIDQFLRISGEHPATFVAFIWGTCICLSIGIGWVTPKYLGVFLISEGWKDADLLTYFGTLWTLQGTIAGLVYPIVIAFVAVLLQRRATAKLSLRLYSLDAAVIPAGASAFALLAWMGIEYIALPYVPSAWLAGAMIGNSAWFVLNVLLTGWFLYRTVRFLNDEERLQVFTRFAVQVAFPREARTHLLGLIFSNAQGNGLIPGKNFGSEDDGPTVLLYPMSEGVSCITVRCHIEKTITDVRLRLLAWGVSLWLRQEEQIKVASESTKVDTRTPLLVVPIIPGDCVEGDLVLCRVRDATPPGPIASYLIRHSVVFGPPPRPETSFSTLEILEELAVETLTLAEQRRFEAAKETLTAIADLHVALIRSGAFINDAGDHDNAALLQEPYGFGSRRLHEAWLGIYRQIAEKAVRDLIIDTTLYRRLCYLAYRIINHARGQNLGILVYVLHLSTHLMYRLGIWWSDKVEERGLVTHDALHSVALPLPLGRAYDRALQMFIEGWESLELREGDEPSNPGDAWDKYSRSAQFAAAQAEQSVRMLLGAVARGDRAAALWLADSFLKWWDKHQHNFGRYCGYIHRNSLLTFACVRKKWPEVRKLLDAVPEGPQEITSPSEVIVGLLRRYWTDLRLLLILILLDWTPAEASDNAFTTEIALALIEGRNFMHGGRVDVEPLKNSTDVLFRLMRIQLVDREYEELLNQIVHYAHDIRKPDMVAGRVYSSFGAHDVESLCLAQGQILVAIAAGQMARHRDFTVAVDHWTKDLQRLQSCQRLFQKLDECIGSEAFTEKSALTATLRRALKLSENLEEARGWIVTAIRDLASLAIKMHDETLERAEISQPILDEIGRNVSDYILSPDNKHFPFFLVSQRKHVSDAGEPRALTISGVGKAPYTDPPLDNDSLSMQDWLNDKVADSIAAGVMVSYIKSTTPEPLRVGSEEAFSEDLVLKANFLRRQGFTPLLIVSGYHRPEWIDPWRYQYEEAEEPPNILVRQPEGGDTSGIIGYFNDVPAYEAPIGEHCYVVAKEHFEILLYTTHSNESCIRVSASAEANQKICLRFEWRFATDFINFKYRLFRR